MIAAQEAQEFVPFGAKHTKQHPGKCQLEVRNQSARRQSADAARPSIAVPVIITPQSNKEWWKLNDRHNAFSGETCDEELYVRGNTLVWSHGNADGVHCMVKTFTMDSPVIEAHWCTFKLPGSDGESSQRAEESLCILESNVASVFTKNGAEYITALPFHVTRSWVINNGMLFERAITPTEIASPRRNLANQTTLFSLLHPLDELAPVISRTTVSGSSKISYVTDPSQQVVFTSSDPSLLLMYDSMIGVHSVWRVRSAKSDEASSATSQFDLNQSYYFNPITRATTPGQTINHSSSSQSRLISTLSSQSPSLSPRRNLSSRVNSPALGFSRSSPSMAHFNNIHSLSQSPLHLINTLPRLHSPSPIRWSPACLYRTPTGSHNVSLILGSESCTEWLEPITPEICLDHLWTETAPAVRDGSLGKASKAFITQDMCGQKFLCYHVTCRHQLRCVKFEESNDMSQLIFGSVAVIQAKDAEPIKSLDMLLVLDLFGSLVLYTGTTKMSKVHVPSLPLSSTSMSLLRPNSPLATPRRGSILTSSRPPSATDARFDEQVKLISPVQTDMDDSSQLESSLAEDFPSINSTGFIQSLTDAVDNRFSIELTNNTLCRSALPQLYTAKGIGLCLKAIRHVLPRDTALLVLIRWYSTRNTLGGSGANQSEWISFIRCILGLMGYDIDRLAFIKQTNLDTSSSPILSKKARTSDQESDEDWEYLVNSDHHRHVLDQLDPALGLSLQPTNTANESFSRPASINPTAPLYAHIPSVLFALHLVYEELKLNLLCHDDVHNLCTLLFQLANDLRLHNYVDYYCREFPEFFEKIDDISQISQVAELLQKLSYPPYMCQQPFSPCHWLYSRLNGTPVQPFPYIPSVCTKIKDIVTLYSLLFYPDLSVEQAMDKCLKRIAPSGHRAPSCDVSLSRSFNVTSQTPVSERIVLYMIQLGITHDDLESYPVGISLPLRQAIFRCQHDPPSDWPQKAYMLIGRPDLSRLALECIKPAVNTVKPASGVNSSQSKMVKDDEDGMDHTDQECLQLRFSEDLRVQEVRRLLQSSHPVRIALTQRPEVSDHEFIEEQERHLLSLCLRTMALSVGRGMFTLCTYRPLPTEILPVPKLCLTGRAPPRNVTVDLTHIDTPTNMSAWPQFHNGVAAGLRIADSGKVESTWILYNKPKSNELTNEHAGFLMALGLTGHLRNLDMLTIHDYLSKGHEMTCVGLTLGLAANKRGSMDLAATRLLSIHVLALLPPTSTELNVAHSVQVASILGVGLLYQGTAHRHTAEIMLQEIGRPPGPEMENSTNRESYSLAAGLAFGLVMFGKGTEEMGLSDLRLANQLRHFMLGGHKQPLMGPNRDRFRSPSYQIREGDSVNIDVTSPGATLALGMYFFSTGNSAVAEWLRAPDTQFTLEHVRPDFLMLRTLSHGLVMWNSIVPSLDWIMGHIPEVVKKYAFSKADIAEDDAAGVNFETMSQAFCNIIAGAAMALALKFAGSSNKEAYDTLIACAEKSLTILSNVTMCEQAGRNTVESCMVVVVLSLAMVMSGSGNLQVLQMCRMLRRRVGAQYVFVTYGSHMALSMAIGLLFFGGGRYVLGTSPEDVGVMLCAFFPKFPKHSNDNRYHLQAFRHLHVLAAKPRVILPRDVDLGRPCYIPLEIKFKANEFYQSQSYRISAPCVLPSLELIDEVKVLGPRYWPMTFKVDKNWTLLSQLLTNGSDLYVKQRAGHLSYAEDPQGYRSMLARSLTRDQSAYVTLKPELIRSFTSDPKVLALAEHLMNSTIAKEQANVQQLSSILHEYVSNEKLDALTALLHIHQIRNWSELRAVSNDLWQLKLILAFYSSTVSLLSKTQDKPQACLIQPEFLYSVKTKVENLLDTWEKENMNTLVQYLQGETLHGQASSYLAPFLIWFDIPAVHDLQTVTVQGTPTLPVLAMKLPTLPVSTLLKILSAWQAAR